MDIQRSIGGDIIMAFDECPPYPSDHGYAETSMRLTHRWLDRCWIASKQQRTNMAIRKIFFLLCRASVFPDLRKASCEYVAAKDAAGNAIGGLSVGEPEEDMYDICAACCEALPVRGRGT